jgi:hypothetical protein
MNYHQNNIVDNIQVEFRSFFLFFKSILLLVKGVNYLPNESFDQTLLEQKQLLEKTAKVLHENQLKNEQLAKQVQSFSFRFSKAKIRFYFQTKIFQENLRRNEIYSALNRYSHRPPIYPTKSQQFKFLSFEFIFL